MTSASSRQNSSRWPSSSFLGAGTTTKSGSSSSTPVACSCCGAGPRSPPPPPLPAGRTTTTTAAGPTLLPAPRCTRSSPSSCGFSACPSLRSCTWSAAGSFGPRELEPPRPPLSPTASLSARGISGVASWVAACVVWLLRTVVYYYCMYMIE